MALGEEQRSAEWQGLLPTAVWGEQEETQLKNPGFALFFLFNADAETDAGGNLYAGADPDVNVNPDLDGEIKPGASVNPCGNVNALVCGSTQQSSGVPLAPCSCPPASKTNALLLCFLSGPQAYILSFGRRTSKT